MGATYNPSIIQDGLAFHVDAGNPRSWSPNRFPNPLDIATWMTANNGGSTVHNTYMTITADPTKAGTSPARGVPAKVVTGAIPTGNTTVYSNTNTVNIAQTTQGQSWTWSAWCYTEGLSFGGSPPDGTFGVSITEYDASGNSLVSTNQSFQAAQYNWQRIDNVYAVTNANTAYIRFRIFNFNANKIFWIDGLQIENSENTVVGEPTTLVPYTTTQWLDLSPNRIHLTPTGPVHNTFLGGARCFQWNGVSYFLSTLADAKKTDFRYGGTLEMWLYAETTAPSARRTIFEKQATMSGVPSYQQELAVTWEVGQDLTYYRHLAPVPPTSTAAAWGATYDNASTAAMTAGAWNHWAIVLYPHLGPGQAYLNGVAVGSYDNRSWRLPRQAGAISIGQGYAGSSPCLNGGIATVRWYTKIFDAADVKYNYNVTKARFGL